MNSRAGEYGVTIAVIVELVQLMSYRLFTAIINSEVPSQAALAVITDGLT